MNSSKKLLRVSIVIPVYNEAAHLPACLDAIARQTELPYEVIVVDNNSTDSTVAIAERYDFVRVLHEPRQGVVFARDAGFDAVRGAVIGRIDADTIIGEDWVARLQSIFADRLVGAVSGSVHYYDMAMSGVLDKIDLYIRRYFAFCLGREVALQGANMAIRRSVWRSIRPSLCRRSGMHEDFDLSIHANQHDYRVQFDENLQVSLAARQTESCLREYAEYIMLSPRTYALHGLKSQRYMYPVVMLAILFYLPLKLLHRGYDSQTERFSWAQLFLVSGRTRVNPATYVD